MNRNVIKTADRKEIRFDEVQQINPVQHCVPHSAGSYS